MFLFYLEFSFRYSKDEDVDDIERDLGDEYGWKQVHGDVFRPATSPLLFSALIGSGAQLAFVVFLVVVFTILGELYTGKQCIHILVHGFM